MAVTATATVVASATASGFPVVTSLSGRAFPGAGRRHAVGQGIARYFFFEKPFDGAEFRHVLFVHKGHRASASPGTGRTSDAVDVILGVVGHVEVDDELDVVNVDASRHDIRGHENADLPVLEAEHHVVALFLFEVGVHGFGIEAVAFEHNVQFFHFLLRRGKDDDAFRRRLAEHLFQNRHFLRVAADIGTLLYLFGGF